MNLNNLYRIIFLNLFFYSTLIFSQSIIEIKEQPDKYLWGEGSGITLDEADQNALRFLVSSLSTHVESEFHQNTEWGTGKEYTENVKMVLSTYSSATLTNTERIVINNEPDARVFRYILKSEVEKIFEKRKTKVIEFVKSAQSAEEQVRIADALKYYYWAFCLLKSYPDGDQIKYTDDNGSENLLLSWIPNQMNAIFANVQFNIKEIKEKETVKTFIVNIQYKDIPVTNLDYSYWEGNDWSRPVSAKDGLGIMEFLGAAMDIQKIQVKMEYLFKGEARIDKELETVISALKPIPFRASYISLDLNLAGNTDIPKDSVAPKDDNNKQLTDYAQTGLKIVTALQNLDDGDVKEICTPQGYEVYQKLIKYGNARVLIQPELQIIDLDKKIMCRSIPMSFSFQNNTKQFIEDVVLHINKETGLVENFSFALSNAAFNSIWDNNVWSQENRITLIDFLEQYKTAYALERIDYINSIFSDDALIITGYFTTEIKKDLRGDTYKEHQIVKYNHYSKSEYISKLKRSFDSKEYINIKFEESSIRKGASPNIFGIQIKQSYCSANYGDMGYLFLLADLNDPKLPVIHVRTWQPEKNEDGSIYGLRDF